jgi:hypothetical protein
MLSLVNMLAYSVHSVSLSAEEFKLETFLEVVGMMGLVMWK